VKHEREDSASELQEREKKYLDKMSKVLHKEHSKKVVIIHTNYFSIRVHSILTTYSVCCKL
jgi:uncharacterized membrane protein